VATIEMLDRCIACSRLADHYDENTHDEWLVFFIDLAGEMLHNAYATSTCSAR
jgi:hypothetical protein